jgi:transposase
LPKPQKEPLHPLSEQEQHELQRIAKASAERMDVIKRARALLAVANGQGFSQAATSAGFASGDTVCQLVARFNQQGLSALLVATGRGRKPTYTHQQRSQIVAELASEPERKEDGSASWSLSLLQQRLRKTGLPQVGASTIRRTLHQAGYVYGQSRTWCQTGTVLRKRKSGVVKVHDPKTQEKKR